MALNIDSNYYLLTHGEGMSKQEQNRRAKWLENAIIQLEQYHIKAKPGKRPMIARLIEKYDSLLETLRR